MKFILLSLKRISWISFTFLGALILALVFILGFLGTDSGKSFLVSRVNNSLEGSPYQIRLHKIKGLYPLKIEVSDLDLEENGKKWLSVNDATINIDLTHIFSEDQRHLKASVFVGSIDLIALPVGKPSKDKNNDLPFDLEKFRTYLEEKLPLNADISIILRRVKIADSIATMNIAIAPLKLIAKYDRKPHNLEAKLTFSTKSFGAPLRAFMEIKGHPTNFNAVTSLKTSRLTYNNIKLTNVTLKSNATGLPFDFSKSLNLDFTYHGLGVKDIQGHIEIKDLTLKKTLINLQSLSLRGLGAIIDGTASYDLITQDVKADLKGNIQDLSPLTGLLGYPVQGALTLDSNLYLISGKQNIKAKIKGYNLNNKDFSLGDLSVTLETSILSETPTLFGTIKGSDFESNGIKFQNLSLVSKINKGQGNVALVGDGKDLNLELKADLSLKKETQEINLKTLGAIFKKQPLKLKKPVRITLYGNDIFITPMTLNLATFPILIEGNKKGTALNFKIKGNADLGLISKLFLHTGDIIDGNINLELAIKGTASSPNISGFIDLKKGEYENIIYGTKLHDLDIRITAENKIIKLDKIKANDGHGGHILVNGVYDLANNAMDFVLKLVDMRFAYTDMMKIIGREGSFRLKGPLSKLKLTGKLKMGDVSYNIMNTFASDVPKLNIIDPLHPELKKTKIANKKEKSTSFGLSMDVAIKIPPTVRIYGMGLDSIWGGKLKISGPATAPLVIGNISADSGELYFLGQDINIEKGVLGFDGQDNNIPYLDLIAGIPRGDFKVIISLSGRATKPSFKISSNPSMPQDQILSYLLFGSEPLKLSPFDAIKLARIAGEIGGIGANSSFSDIMKNRTEEKESDEEKEKNYKSKSKMSDFVRVRLDQGVTPADTKVVVDVAISPSITVTTSAGAGEASQSLGIKYKWDY